MPKLTKCPKCNGKIEKIKSKGRNMIFECLECKSRFVEKDVQCPECGQDKVEHYIDKEVEFFVCKECNCTFLPNGEVIPADDDIPAKVNRKEKKMGGTPWYLLMWVSGIIIVLEFFVAIITIWGGLSSGSSSSDLEDMYNTVRLCATFNLLTWIIYIYSSLMVHKESREGK